MAYERGLLTSPDVNTLQELCLQTYKARQLLDESEQQEQEFELQLFLHRPDVYEEYMKEKKERQNSEYDQIVWQQPETIEELEFILSTVQEHEKTIQEEQKEFSNHNDSIEIEFLKQFEGIDISQLGDDDG